MTDTETLLRQTFRDHEHLVGEAGMLAQDARARAARSRRLRANATVATAAVVVVAVAVTGYAASRQSATPIRYVTGGPSQSPSQDLSSPTPSRTAAVPSGWQTVSAQGLEVSVPGSWPISSFDCSAPAESRFVVIGGEMPACGVVWNRAYTTVTVEPVDTVSAADGETQIRTTQLEVNGHPATERRATEHDGAKLVTLTIPDRHATVEVTGPDETSARRILATTTVVDVDFNGCSWQVPARPSWDHPRSGPSVDPGHPTSISVCSYSRSTLETSGTVKGAASDAIVAALRQAKPGKAPDVPSTDCIDVGPLPVADLRLILHTPNGDVPLSGHYENCTDRYIASPDGVSQMTQAFIKAALTPLHVGWGFSGPLPEQ